MPRRCGSRRDLQQYPKIANHVHRSSATDKLRRRPWLYARIAIPSEPMATKATKATKATAAAAAAVPRVSLTLHRLVTECLFHCVRRWATANDPLMQAASPQELLS